MINSPKTRTLLLISRQHYVDIKSFLDCNKIKKLGYTTPAKFIEAIKDSTDLEINPENTQIRKKEMTNLPEFKGKKKVKTDQDGLQKANPYVKMET